MNIWCLATITIINSRSLNLRVLLKHCLPHCLLKRWKFPTNKKRVQALTKNLMQMCFPPNMFMPYIEGPCMGCTVNDGLYHRFLKWRLKYENILECKFAALPECQNCKKVVAWNGDFGMDQYVSWSLPKEDLSLDTIWEHFEEFCKPQANGSKGLLWFIKKLQTRYKKNWWMVQCGPSTDQSCQIPSRDCQDTT